jgi:hypothetical protein
MSVQVSLLNLGGVFLGVNGWFLRRLKEISITNIYFYDFWLNGKEGADCKVEPTWYIHGNMLGRSMV